MSGAQIALRDELASRVLRDITEGKVDVVQAAIALMGVAAAVVGTLPPKARDAFVSSFDGQFAEMVEMRAKQIRSGEWDSEVASQ